MKVYIAPYSRHFTSKIHTKYMTKRYGRYKWPETNYWFENFLEKLEDYIQVLYDYTVNRFFYGKRKIKVRVDKYDTYNMDETLSHIIHPLLKQLKVTKHGIPCDIDMKDLPKELRLSKVEMDIFNSNKTVSDDKRKEVDQKVLTAWNWIIDEMIHSFECTINDEWDQQFYNRSNNTLTFNKEAYEKAWERRKNGLRLFGKYFHSHWD